MRPHYDALARGARRRSMLRYSDETKRLLSVIDDRLEDREFLACDYSIADIATVPWVAGLDFYGGSDARGFETYSNIARWIPACLGRPSAVRGVEVCAF